MHVAVTVTTLSPRAGESPLELRISKGTVEQPRESLGFELAIGVVFEVGFELGVLVRPGACGRPRGGGRGRCGRELNRASHSLNEATA